MKLSIIIVHYNVAGYLKNCLASIEKYAPEGGFEVLVIDNSSPDPSWMVLKNDFPAVKFITNSANEGFAKANNEAAKIATGEYLFFLNPDTELRGSYLPELLDFGDKYDDFGALGLAMYNTEETFLPESKRSLPTISHTFGRLFLGRKKSAKKSYYRNDIPENAIAEVEILTGANLLIRRNVFEKLGGFDERYFMYGEDIDLCYTLLRAGYRNFYYGKYSILHHKGRSAPKDAAHYGRFYGAMQVFVDKYYGHRPVQRTILIAGLSLRKKLALLSVS